MSIRDSHEQLNSPSNTDASSQDARTKWLAELQPPTSAHANIEQSAVKVSDRAQPSAASDAVTVNPNKLIAQAQADGKEIAGYAGKDVNETIHVKDSKGHTVLMTVGDRIKELQTQINTDSQNAIVASDRLASNNPNLQSQLSENQTKLDSAAQAAGLNARDPNFLKNLEKAAQSATTPEQHKDLENIITLANQQQVLQSERFAPAAARMSYAMLMADGLTDNPVASLQSAKANGVPKASDKELTDAFMLMSQAGRTDTEVANSPLFSRLSGVINSQYANTQQERGQKIITDLTKANELSRSGDTTNAETYYKQAAEQAQAVDQKWLAAQLQIPANANNPQIAQAMVGIIADVKEAKMDYANFLNGQARFSEALPLVLQVQADTPEMAQQDPSFNRVLNKATFGNSMDTGDLQSHQAKFAQLMQEHKFDDASKELDVLRKNYQDTKATLDTGDKALDGTKTDINKQLQDLDKNKGSMDPTEYKIEQARLQNEINVINQNEKANTDLNKQGDYLTYLQGVLAYSKNDTDTAHTLFESVKGDPEIANNKDLNLNALLDATKHQNWFERNWHAVATAGAVVAGIGVGVAAGFLTGPGGIAAGIGTTGAILSAIGGGAAAGGLAFGGIKGATLGFDKVGWSDLGEGAVTGAVSAATAGAGPLFGGARLVAGEATAGVAAETSNSFLAGTMGRIGLGMSLRGAAVGSSLAVGKEGYQVAFQGKSLDDAGKSLLWEAPLGAVLGVGAAARGLTFSTIGLNGRSLAVGAGIAGAKEGSEVAFDGKSWKDAAQSFVLEAPLYGASVGLGMNAVGKVLPVGGRALTAETLQPALLAGAKVAAGFGMLAPAFQVASDAYQTHSPFALPMLGRPDHLQLDPSDAKQNQQIWSRWNSVNPNLYAPSESSQPVSDSNSTAQQADASSASAAGGDANGSATPYTRLSQADIQKLSSQPIQDEPVS